MLIKKVNGFSVIEILLAVFILLIIFLGVSYLLLDNLQNSFDNQERVKAEFLVQEGLESVRAISENEWDGVTSGTHGLVMQNNIWILSSSIETVAQHLKNGQRVIEVEEMNDHLKKIKSTVNWSSLTDNNLTTFATTFVSNWQEVVSECADGLDNDGDGFADYPEDPGCDSLEDEDETDSEILPQCSDGLDNDLDGFADYPEDPGCDSASDDNEEDSSSYPQCSDGTDNDLDGFADYPEDPGCDSASDDDETDPINTTQCSDGLDNDGDGFADFPEDPGCDSTSDDDETDPNNILPECSDDLDNDGDDLVDYPNDPGCDSPEDNDEENEEISPECSDGLDNDGDGFADYPEDPGCDSTSDDDETDPVNPGSCTDNDGDGYNIEISGCGPVDCDDNNELVYPGSTELCENGLDDDCDNLIDCEDNDCTGEDCCQANEVDVVFDQNDQSICEYDETLITATGYVVLNTSQKARLQLSYQIVNPDDKRTEIVYVNKGLVKDGDTFSLEVPWPGIRASDEIVEIHVEGVLLNKKTDEPLMTPNASLDYFWYPWVCPAPTTECTDDQDNDGDNETDYPQDLGCTSLEDDSEYGSCLDSDGDGYFTPGYDCLPTATIQPSGNIIAPKGNMQLKVVTSQIQCGPGGSEVSVKTGLSLNNNFNWLFGGNDVDGGEIYNISIAENTNIYMRGTAWSNSCLPGGRSYTSNSNSAFVLVFKDGDSLPILPRFGSQQTLPEVLIAFVDENKKIDIDVNQVLLIWELGTTDINSDAADFQDLVVLLTFSPDHNQYCDCGPFDCNDNDPNVNPGQIELDDNQIDDNCDFMIDENDVGTCDDFPCGPPTADKVNICHAPGTPAENTLCVSKNLVEGHLTHDLGGGFDYCGICEADIE